MPVTVRFDPTANSQQASIIPDASIKNDGVMTAAQVAQLNQLSQAVAFNAVNLYVNPTTGNDANSGSASAPFKTLQAALLALPSLARSTAILNIQNDGVTPATVQFPLGEAICFPYMSIEGSPLLIQSTPITTVSLTATGLDLTGNTVTDAGATLVPDAERGNSLVCISGANIGSRRKITSNTITDVTVNLPFSNPITPGDQYNIITPGAIIQYDAVEFANCTIGLIDVELQAANLGFGSNFMALISTSLFGIGLKWDLNGGFVEITGNASEVFIGTLNGPFSNIPNSLFTTLPDFLSSDGLYALNGVIDIFGHTFMFSTTVLDNITLISHVSTVSISIDSRQSTISADTRSRLDMSGFGKTGSMDGTGLVGTTPAISVTNDSSTTQLDVSINSYPGDALFADGRSYIDATLTKGGAPGPTANVGFGIHVVGMSQALYDPASVGAVTGTAGDTSVGASIQSYVALGANGFTESNAGGPTLNRLGPLGV